MADKTVSTLFTTNLTKKFNFSFDSQIVEIVPNSLNFTFDKDFST